MESLKGHLLIAVPELPDPNFFRSVVLLIHHDEMGASGVILNRPADVPIRQVWNEVSESETECDDPINVGGPVEGPLIAVHTSLASAETQVVPGVFVSMGKDNLNSIVSQSEHPFRLFCGYAGWGPQQLESEIDHGGWLTMPAHADHVFESPDRLWKIVCETFGHEVLKAQIGKHFPSDPSMN
jgi:putative transcriptional regulator